MSDLISAYLAHIRAGGYAPDTVAMREYLLRRLDKELPSGLATADSDELAGWFAQYQGWTLHTYWSHAHGFYAWATTGRDPYVDYNPMTELIHPRSPKCLPRPVSDAQAATALALPPPWGVAATLGFYGGLRCGEIARLDRADITPEHMTILRKGGKRASVEVHAEVWRAVTDLPPGPVVTNARGDRWIPNRLSRAFSAQMTAAGMPDVTLHRFRHAYATRLLLDKELGGAGVDIRVIQELLGHEQLSSTQIYCQVTGRQRRLAVQALPTLTTPSQDAA